MGGVGIRYCRSCRVPDTADLKETKSRSFTERLKSALRVASAMGRTPEIKYTHLDCSDPFELENILWRYWAA